MPQKRYTVSYVESQVFTSHITCRINHLPAVCQADVLTTTLSRFRSISILGIDANVEWHKCVKLKINTISSNIHHLQFIKHHPQKMMNLYKCSIFEIMDTQFSIQTKVIF